MWTPRLLDLLRSHHARATFFLHGKDAARNPELVRQILHDGHEIGSYTYSGGDLGVASRCAHGSNCHSLRPLSRARPASTPPC